GSNGSAQSARRRTPFRPLFPPPAGFGVGPLALLPGLHHRLGQRPPRARRSRPLRFGGAHLLRRRSRESRRRGLTCDWALPRRRTRPCSNGLSGGERRCFDVAQPDTDGGASRPGVKPAACLPPAERAPAFLV